MPFLSKAHAHDDGKDTAPSLTPPHKAIDSGAPDGRDSEGSNSHQVPGIGEDSGCILLCNPSECVMLKCETMYESLDWRT